MAYANVETWQPSAKSRVILDRAKEHIESVPYKVSARWVFYRLLQDGIYTKKADYKNTFISLTSRARHSGYWDPDVLADETREAVIFEPEGWDTPEADINEQIELARVRAKEEIEDLRESLENYRYSHNYQIDSTYFHDSITVVMFEARAMEQQFRLYADGLTLCPFGGQPSIPYKYEIAKYLETQHEKYGKPLLVLYFGDYDEAGQTIFNTALEDIGKWCNYEIRWEFCGLTREQVESYKVPENLEHEGYQWEALTDKQAAEIIQSSIRKFVDIDEANRRAWRESWELRQAVERAVNEELEEEHD